MPEPIPESDLLRRIADASAGLHGFAGAFGQVVVGPGDDCAVIRSASGDLLLIGVDQLVEGRHFESDLLQTDEGLDLVARKSVARAVSDIAAMGGQPAWGLATGLLPAGFDRGAQLFDAMSKWARHWNAPLIGGDIAFGSQDWKGPLSLTVTVAGVMEHGADPVLRCGARPGQHVYVTGQIGGSLESGWHLRFEPRVEVGRALADLHARSGSTGAMIDLSDGLGRDAARIGAASNVRIEIEAARLPLSHRSPDWRTAGPEGEDYELLFTTDPDPDVPSAAPPVTRIGVVRACRPGEAPGATIIDPHGRTHDARDLGWDHR